MKDSILFYSIAEPPQQQNNQQSFKGSTMRRTKYLQPPTGDWRAKHVTEL